MLKNALHRETKFAPVDLKAVDTDGTFEGYASVFGAEDMAHDVVMPGAFAASLAARGPQGVKLLFQHDPAQPIGVWLELAEDKKGLYARGRLMPEVARAREVLSLMRAGALDGLSIGFRTVKGVRDAKSGIRRLNQIDLWEISVVTFPMLPEARVETVKTRPFAGRVPTEREFERWLTRDAGLSRTQAQAIIRSGLKSLTARRDAAGESSEEHATLRAIRAATQLMSSP
ncbi:MAG: HK97 family phage prohead protease [Hyphomicrobiaceae bacterium]